jgi:hypothetical protein
MKLRIKRRLVRILVEDVGSRDEKLARMEKEATRAKEELVQAQGDLTEAQQELNNLRPIQQKLDKLDKRHTINKWAFPTALVLATLIGGVVTLLTGLPIFIIIVWSLLIILAAYYTWTYYLS